MNNFLHDFITNILIVNIQPLNNNRQIGTRYMISYGVLFYNYFIDSNISFNLDQEFHDYDELPADHGMDIFLRIDKKADNPIILLTFESPPEIISIYIVNDRVIYAALSGGAEILNITTYFQNNNLNTNLEYFYSLFGNFLDHYADTLRDEVSFIRNVESGYLVYNHFMTEVLFPMLQYVNIPDYCLSHDPSMNSYRFSIMLYYNNFQIIIQIIIFNDKFINFTINIYDYNIFEDFIYFVISIEPPYTIDNILQSKMTINPNEETFDLTNMQNKLIIERKKLLKKMYESIGEFRKNKSYNVYPIIAEYANIGREMKDYEPPSPQESKEQLIGVGGLNENARQSAMETYDYLNNDTRNFINHASDQVLNMLADEKYLISEDNICSICMLEHNEDTVETNCGHQFHRKCLKTWLKKQGNKNCPVCGHIIIFSEPHMHIILFIHEIFMQYIVNTIRYLSFNSDFDSYSNIIEQGIDNEMLHMNVNILSNRNDDDRYIVTFYVKFNSIYILYDVLIDKETNRIIRAILRINDKIDNIDSDINNILGMNLDE